MKLRNKKTGEIREAIARDDGIYLKANWSDSEAWYLYTLDTLAHDWEYYIEPAEPLIKDEKIRKVVRLWADFNGIKEVTYFKEDFGLRLAHYTISIDLYVNTDELENYEHYTIAELCGEEE